ncbi:carbohydrate sulfotransferase 13-like [Ylistrum balloti]|uniref:carbohydrate sulfotransferase 13-like n=1 Tax=Ylistrum balloti TaxID=509963 RepID=UPI0029058E33|nr:carbohydrate sulfotransferase 13-like [Ylistrum balloti]
MRTRCLPRRLLTKPRWWIVILSICVLLFVFFALDFNITYSSVAVDPIARVSQISNVHETLQDSRIAARFQQRNSIIHDGCQNLKQYYAVQDSEAAVKEHLVVDSKNQITYCAIEKIGCTFWKRIFQILSGWQNVSDPFRIKGIHAYEGYQTAKRLPFDKIYNILVHSTKFMFVREPFERLLSGYVDKLYSPNAAYWNFIGRYIVTRFRENPTNHSAECGHDITFQEFVEYFIYSQSTNEHRDAHFVPSFEHCRPCEIEYDYIGKMETFKEDTFHILKKLNLEKYVKFNDFQNETETDAIIDTVDYVYSMRRPIQKCMTLPQALFRAWRKLQIRGIISKYIKFPYPLDYADNIHPNEFKRLLLDAHAMSGDPAERKKNRHEALLEAYSNLTPVTMDRLKEALYVDAVLFGYDTFPDKLRNLGKKKSKNDGFTYFKLYP